MKKQYWLTAATFVLIGHLSGNPAGPQAISGDLTFHFHGKTLEIRAPDQSIVHWDDFSIDAGELTRFIQPNASATVLNKVLGLNPSLINGALEANGKVILINPQGVIVGKGGIIRTADFIASTLDHISSTVEGMEFAGESTASIVNYGTIKTAFGDVVLIATTVNNSGTVEAPLGKVLIGAGSNVLLAPASEERIFIRPSLSSGSIENNGVLSATEVALKTEGSAYALAINAGGLIQATDVVESNGKIFLVAEGGLLTLNGTLESPKGTVELRGDKVLLGDTARVDVSSDTGGGTVLIGTHHLKNDPSNVYSDMIYLDPQSEIKADALVQGDGGKVIIWSETSTQAHGAISGRGGPFGGNGGFVELSGRKHIIPNSIADLRAPLGRTGTLLIDPSDVLIFAFPGGGVTFNACPTPATLSVANTLQDTVLSAQLAAACVIIDTSVGPGITTGNITVDQTANVIWASPNPLTLSANDTITINGTINCTAGTPGGNITLTTTTGPTGTIAIDANTFSTPAKVITAAGNIVIQANAPVASAAVSIIAGSGVLNSATVQGVNVTLNAVGTTGNVIFIDSEQAMPASAIVQSTVGGALAISAPNAVSPGGILIQTDNGGFTNISSVLGAFFGPMGITTGGDFNINNTDGVSSGATNTLIHYGDGTNKFEANNFSFIANTGGIYQFRQDFNAGGSTVTFSANNNFTMKSSCTFPGNISGCTSAGPFFGTANFTLLGGTLDMELDPLTGAAVGTVEIRNTGPLHIKAPAGITMLTKGNFGNVTIVGSGLATVTSATGNINLDGTNGTASIGTSQALTVGAGQNIILGVNSSLFIQGNTLLAIANQNIQLTDATSTIGATSPSGKAFITLVVDNGNAIPPSNGPFGLLMVPGSSIQPVPQMPPVAPPTQVTIFTSEQSFNVIAGTTINQVPFVEGPVSINTPQEQWGVWYLHTPSTPPVASAHFVKFNYKQPPPILPPGTTIPNIPWAQIAQLIGNAYDDIEIYQYDLPPYQDVFCMHVCDLQEKKELSRLKQSYWSRTWVDKEGRFFENDWCDFVKIDNYRKFYQNRQRVVPFYAGLQDEIDALNAVTCPTTIQEIE